MQIIANKVGWDNLPGNKPVSYTHLKIQTQYPHAWGYIHAPSPDKCTTAWEQKSCCTQRIAVSYTHLDVYKRQSESRNAFKLAIAVERTDAIACSPAVSAAPANHLALCSGGRRLKSCLLYTSRCV